MIASHLTPANGPMQRPLSALALRYVAIPGNLDTCHVAALKELRNLAYRVSATLTYADAFRAISAGQFGKRPDPDHPD